VQPTQTVTLTADGAPGRLRADVRVSSMRGNSVSDTTGLYARRAGRPQLIASPGIPLSIVTATPTAFDLSQTQAYDPDVMLSGANPTRALPPVAGWYLVTANVCFGNSGGMVRQGYVRLNGVTTIAYRESHANPFGPGKDDLALWTVYPFNGSTDYVELVVQQTSGGDISTNVALSIVRVG
jgi:hypothetical protein